MLTPAPDACTPLGFVVIDEREETSRFLTLFTCPLAPDQVRVELRDHRGSVVSARDGRPRPVPVDLLDQLAGLFLVAPAPSPTAEPTAALDEQELVEEGHQDLVMLGAERVYAIDQDGHPI